jgi:hypothetical protein
VLREHDVPGGDNIGLMAHTAAYCLGRGHVFYLDVPLEETLRRHEGRPLRSEVPAQKLREWFVPGDLLGWPGEVVLDGTQGPATVLADVLAHIGAVSRRPPRARDTARFL